MTRTIKVPDVGSPRFCVPERRVCATDGECNGQDAHMAADLHHQMEALERCIVDRDEDLADRVLDEDFALVLVQPQQAVMPRARWLDVLADYVVHHVEVQEQVIDADTDCAVVLRRVRMSATVLAEDRSGVFVISDIWRRRGDEWRIWRRHSTPLDAGAMRGAEPT